MSNIFLTNNTFDHHTRRKIKIKAGKNKLIETATRSVAKNKFTFKSKYLS
jgi:hypothetical protein